ncbi:MAG: two-component system response regulator [Pseudonocardiales bacterium]|nr:two-component system response regulator [Pseudonocardiales bacterium]
MTTTNSSRDRQLSDVFVTLADSLVSGYDIVDLMGQLVSSCVGLFQCDAAGLLLADNAGNLRVMASSSEEVKMLELLEVQNSEGPCLECFNTGRAVAAVDLTCAGADERWPRFSPAARAAGFSFVQAVPLRLREQTIGAMNLMFQRSYDLSADDGALAQALADVATIAVLQQRAMHERDVLTDQLQRALTHRLIIEQAKGVLAERGALSIDEAFNKLRDYCRYHRLAISGTAAKIVNSELNPSAIISH